MPCTTRLEERFPAPAGTSSAWACPSASPGSGAGDLLFTEGGGHVQLVVSTSAAISAPQTGERVRYVPLAELRPEFAGARRLLK
jgi:hypothetical protein